MLVWQRSRGLHSYESAMMFRKEHRVFVAIRRRLLLAHWRPETRIKPANLADTLGVSASPVREALIRLTERGLLTNAENLGFVVTSYDPIYTSHYCALLAHLYAESIERIADPERLHAAGDELARALEVCTEENASLADAFLQVAATCRGLLILNPYHAIADQIDDYITAHGAFTVASERYYLARLNDLRHLSVRLKTADMASICRSIRMYFRRRATEIMRATVRLSDLPALTNPTRDHQHR